MILNKNDIKDTLDQVAAKWDYSGYFMLYKDGECLHNNHYGYKDRERDIKTDNDTRYTMDARDMFFTGLAALTLIDEGVLSLDDTLKKFMPEYGRGEKVTVENLLRNHSGIPDFYHGRLLVELESDEGHMALSEHDRVRREKHALYKNRDFATVLSLVEACDLEYEPGTQDHGSGSNAIFLGEVIRRASGKSALENLQDKVFGPLQMTGVSLEPTKESLSYTVYKEVELVSLPYDYEIDGLFDVTAEDMEKLLLAMCEGKILSRRLWKKVLKFNADGEGILFSNANGFDCVDAECLGYGFYAYINQKTGVAFASLVNEQQTYKHVGDSWEYFRKDSREAVTSLVTYPEDTKMVKLSKSNFWDAMNLSIRDDQNSFVLDPKSSVGMGLVYGAKKVFVQMEGSVSVGLLVLNVDKKKKDYNIDIIIIDQKYQGRGYGKLMVKWAVDYLKKEGAKTLTIGVSRRNIGAKKIYMNAGFEPKAVYGGGMELVMEL